MNGQNAKVKGHFRSVIQSRRCQHEKHTKWGKLKLAEEVGLKVLTEGYILLSDWLLFAREGDSKKSVYPKICGILDFIVERGDMKDSLNVCGLMKESLYNIDESISFLAHQYPTGKVLQFQ